MRHIPHLLIPRPWGETRLHLDPEQVNHVRKVLRGGAGDTVSYTDGHGTVGEGSLDEKGSIARGLEKTVPRPTELSVAVAPPASRERQRFLVEKLSEMGVARLQWIGSAHGSNRVATERKLEAWAKSGLEQSRGAWLIDVGTSLVAWDDLEEPIAVCEPGAGKGPVRPRTVVVGPEGGWADGEVPADAGLMGLGPTILRVETAAVVAAAILSREDATE